LLGPTISEAQWEEKLPVRTLLPRLRTEIRIELGTRQTPCMSYQKVLNWDLIQENLRQLLRLLTCVIFHAYHDFGPDDKLVCLSLHRTVILTGSVDIRYPCPLPSSFHLRDKHNTADDHRKLTSDGAAWQCLKRYQLAAWSLGAGNLVKLYHCVQLACSACWSSFSKWLAGHALGLQAKNPDPHFASLFSV